MRGSQVKYRGIAVCVSCRAKFEAKLETTNRCPACKRDEYEARRRAKYRAKRPTSRRDDEEALKGCAIANFQSFSCEAEKDLELRKQLVARKMGFYAARFEALGRQGLTVSIGAETADKCINKFLRKVLRK